jgi:hypothetical protein
MSWRSATTHRYGESLVMPGFQGCPFFLGQVGTDDCFSIDNCLEWHTDPICFLSIKSARHLPVTFNIGMAGIIW